MTKAPDIHGGSAEERVAALLRLLDVTPREDRLFEGNRKRGGAGRIFGGEAVAQALAAASKTVPHELNVHSLHAYFLRGGSEDHASEYRVEADFDGRSFSNRRVVALQQGEVILNLTASFHGVEPGHHHQAAMPDVPYPENLPDLADALGQAGGSQVPGAIMLRRPWPVEMRHAPPHSRTSTGASDQSIQAYWFRAVAPVDAPQWMHRAILAYVSDLGPLPMAALPYQPCDIQGASIDHSLWFHRDVRADNGLLFHLESPWAGGARGLGTGRIFDREGNLIASVAQEGLMRDRAFRLS